MWKWIFRPDVLFLLGTLQMLLPYMIFMGDLIPELRIFQVSYYPMAIYAIGYLCFFIGTKLIPRERYEQSIPEVPVSLSTLKAATTLLTFAAGIQIVGLAKVYGGIPILQFISGAAEVSGTNSAEAGSGFGQIGGAFLTSLLLFALLLLLAIKAQQSKAKVTTWLIGCGSICLLIQVFNGKRQGLIMLALYSVVVSTIAFGSPWGILRALNIRVSGRKGIIAGILAAATMLGLISGLANLRNAGEGNHEAFEELALYYMFPMMNMSLQCIESGGFGPLKFQPLGVIVTLLPAKSGLFATLQNDEPPRVEKTSPSGFYERLQWDMGLWGIIPFAVLCGMFCQYVYQKAFHRYAALLAYAFISWGLFSAALYNHFLNLLFLPVPVFVCWIASSLYREFTQLRRIGRVVTAPLQEK